MTDKIYDVIIFGVTGFTGKLAVEYLLKKDDSSLKWAACARSESRAMATLKEIADSVDKPAPTLVIADLICQTAEDETKLRNIVASTKVVITAAGPFEKYGITLHKLCAEEGVHYADITGETSFFRHVIDQHDDKARTSKATLVSHCGTDCIPQDLTVFEMDKYAKSKGCKVRSIAIRRSLLTFLSLFRVKFIFTVPTYFAIFFGFTSSRKLRPWICFLPRQL